jgi:hypothetical protein
MGSEYWQQIPELEQLIAGQETQQAIQLIEKLLVEYGNLEHSLYLKGVCLEQENLLMKNADALNQLAKAILAGDNSTITHLDKAFRWFYLTEDWDNCCQSLDRLLGHNTIPTSLPPGLYFHLAGPIRRESIRQLLMAEHLRAHFSEHPFIRELGILFQNSMNINSRNAKKNGPIVMLISDESIGDHFGAINNQLRQLNYPTVVFDGGIDGSSEPPSPTELQTWLNDINPLAVFIQTPYLETLPILWQPVLASQSICVPGYGPHLSGDDFWWGSSRGQFGLSGFVLARYVFAANHSIARSFYDCGLSSSQVVLTGDPLTWSMRRDSLIDDPQTTFDLLWAPHWTPLNVTGRRRAYRNIERDIELVLDFAEAGNSVCLRPHPLFVKRIEEDPNFLSLALGALDQNLHHVWEELIAHKNVKLSSATMVEDCLRCKRLLTDGISIVFYWALTGKPTAISYRPDSPTFAEFAAPLLNEIPKLLTENDTKNWLADASTHSQATLIERCYEIIPDNQQSPIEIFLEFTNHTRF